MIEFGVPFAGAGEEKKGGEAQTTTAATTTTTNGEGKKRLFFLLSSSSPQTPSPHDVALFRYAIRSVRSWGFLSPAKTILVPKEGSFSIFIILREKKKESAKVSKERSGTSKRQTKDREREKEPGKRRFLSTYQGCTSSG